MNRLRRVPHLATWSGLGLCLAGATLLVIAWSQTARTTNVGLQLPYVLSAGCTGLGLLMVGLTVVGLSAKWRESRERTAHAIELRELLGQIRQALESDAR